MSEVDAEKAVSTEEEDEKSLSRSKGITARNRKSVTELRHPRQKFCARWQHEFPWLEANNINEAVGNCRICQCQLVCKKSHLVRHQNSNKHKRLAGFERADSDAGALQPTATEFLECGRGDAEEESDDSAHGAPLEFDSITITKARAEEHHNGAVKDIVGSRSKYKRPKYADCFGDDERPSAVGQKLDRFQLLQRIDRDRNELNECYHQRRLTASDQVPEPPVRDSFDLFFESVSVSVKALPPKWATEIKHRVSQMITEYEIRAICEREEQLKRVSSATEEAGDTQTPLLELTSQEELHSKEVADMESSTVGSVDIVYTFEPK